MIHGLQTKSTGRKQTKQAFNIFKRLFIYSIYLKRSPQFFVIINNGEEFLVLSVTVN